MCAARHPLHDRLRLEEPHGAQRHEVPQTAPSEAEPSGARRGLSFESRVHEILDGGALTLLLSIGHRTGLFDVMASMPPADSRAIARESGLDERYVREWLAAMVAGGVVRFDAARCLYELPVEHAGLLTRSAGAGNLAVPSQWIALLGAVEDELVDAFQNGGGVPFGCYRRFHKVTSEDSGQRIASVLASELLPVVPGLCEALERGVDVLDVGCGVGRILCDVAQRYPRSRFLGIDLSVEAIADARREASGRRLKNVRFEERDGESLPVDAHFELAFAFGVIHRQPEPERVLATIARALRPNGVLIMQEEASTGSAARDAERPLAAFSYALSCLQSLASSRAAGGAALGSMWGASGIRRSLAAAGFHRIVEQRVMSDPRSTYFIAREPGQRWNVA
jgi:SAM-dependent methyltransferase